MNILIRTDASAEIGTGHVMRCVTLAKQLVKDGAKVTFICRDFPGNCISFIQSEGFSVHILAFNENQNHWQWVKGNWKQDAVETKNVINSFNSNIDLFIIDHYSIDIKWECELRSEVKYIMVIDDLADRPHDCDVLLDQNYYLNMQERYKGIVPDYCTLLLGPNYVLLRDQFISFNPQTIKRDGNVNNILVFLGGADHVGATFIVLQSILELDCPDITFHIVVGAANPRKNELEQFCSKVPNITFYYQIDNMAELMKNADLAIGAGGASTWERCYLKLPSLTIIIAENQIEVTNAVAHQGATISLGDFSRLNVQVIKKELLLLLHNKVLLKQISKKCSELVNSFKVKEYPVKNFIMELCL